MVYLGKTPFTTDVDFTRASVNESITGSWTFTQDILGTTIRSRWADLAERYEIDYPAAVGSIVKFGGIKEITITQPNDVNPFGILSTQPGLALNENAGTDETHPFVALIGRVPCRIIGRVNKGDYIVPSSVAGVGTPYVVSGETLVPSYSVGIALQSKFEDAEGLVEIFTKAVL